MTGARPERKKIPLRQHDHMTTFVALGASEEEGATDEGAIIAGENCPVVNGATSDNVAFREHASRHWEEFLTMANENKSDAMGHRHPMFGSKYFITEYVNSHPSLWVDDGFYSF